MGFQTPIVDWLKGPWKNYFSDLINSSDFLKTDVIDAEAVKRRVERVMNEDVTYREGELAYAALQPYLWKRAVFDRFGEMNRSMRK